MLPFRLRHGRLRSRAGKTFSLSSDAPVVIIILLLLLLIIIISYLGRIYALGVRKKLVLRAPTPEPYGSHGKLAFLREKQSSFFPN